MSRFTFFAEKPVRPYHKGDVLFVASVIILCGLGLVSLYVCTPYKAERLFGSSLYFVRRQMAWAAVGLAGMIAFSVMPVRVMKRILPALVIGTLILCLMTLVPGIGDSRKGAPRWIRIPVIGTVQPSEFAKMALVLFLANLFDKIQRQDDEFKNEQRDFLYPLIGLMVFVMVIFLQKDFSTGLFIFAVGCIMFFVSGARMLWIFPLLSLAVPAAVLMVVMEPYRLMRVVAFFKPEDFLLTSGYQRFASRRAIIAGGFWGNGMGSGMQYVNSIPEVQADYIFAGWTNVMGFVGVIAYAAVLFVFAWRAFRIALTCPCRFASYSAYGSAIVIVFQSLINIGVVCGALPTTGIPLPFFSSGGSSLLATMCMCGIIINASCCDEDDEMESVRKYSEKNIESFNGVVVENE